MKRRKFSIEGVTSFLRMALVLLATSLTAATAWADSYPEYITDIAVVGGSDSEAKTAAQYYENLGYTTIYSDLNDNAGGDYIYLCYKKGSRASTDGGYITDLRVYVGSTYSEEMTFDDITYYLAPRRGGSWFTNDVKGDLNSGCGSGTADIHLYYTKNNFTDKRVVNSVWITNGEGTGSGAVSGVDLNQGCGKKSDYIYLHMSTTTKVNRPEYDPVFKTDLVYNGSAQQLLSDNPKNNCTMYYCVDSNSGSFVSSTASVTATTAGTHTVYYYAGANDYGNRYPSSNSSAFSQTVNIAKSSNSNASVSVNVSSKNIYGYESILSKLSVDNNLSTGSVTWLFSESANGTYSTTVPTTVNKTYYVKACIAGDNNCEEYTTGYATFYLLDWTGDGTSSNPYQINNIYDMNRIATRVNAGNSYSGKYFKLTTNLTYSSTDNYTAIGTSSNNFYGTFDGGGFTISGINISQASTNFQGLFGYIGGGAVVKDVNLTNSVILGYDYSGGIAACNVGTVSGCTVASTVQVQATSSGAYYHGGIVGYNNGTVSGCTSSAQLTCASGKYYGGIVGYNNGGTVSGNFVIGATVPSVTNYYGAIVGYNNSIGTLSNNYYYNCTVAGVSNATGVGCNGADVTSNNGAVSVHTLSLASGVSTSTSASKTYNGTNYYANGTTVELSASLAEGLVFIGYSVNGNEISGASFSMPSQNTTVTANATDLWGVMAGANGSSANPYVITTTEGLDLLAEKVNTSSDYVLNYAGKYFELGADIAYDRSVTNNYTPIGSERKYFSGHFDGKGHKVSGINISRNSVGYNGIFGNVYNNDGSAEIKNVTIDDSYIEGRSQSGGIVGSGYGCTVSNCHATSSVTIHGSYSWADAHGGIVGYNNRGRVIGCTSSANVTAGKYSDTNDYISGTNTYGGIVGNNYYGTVENCLVYGGNISGLNDIGAVVGQNWYGSLSNNWYSGFVTLNGEEAMLNDGVGSDDKSGTGFVCAIVPYEGVTLNFASGTATTEYDYNGLKIYSTGMSYGGQYYNFISNGDDISGDVTFTATYTGSVPADHALSGFGSTSIADDTEVEMKWAVTNGSATCELCTYIAIVYYIAPTFREAIWGDGDGSQSNPYIITSVNGMNSLATRVNSGENDYSGKYFELGADITFDGTENNYTPIGNHDHPFGANFDGKGHTISGININTGNDCQGIFGMVSYCTIQNIALTNSTIICGGYGGGIFGWGNGVTVSNCHVTETVSIHGNGTNLGGIGAYAMYGSTIKGCTSAAKITCKYAYGIGGVMGGMNAGTFKDCLYLGPKFDTTKNGAVLGSVTQTFPTMSNCYHTPYGMNAVGYEDMYDTNFAVVTADKPECASATVTATYGTGSYTGITVYGSVLYYNGKYYWYDENLMKLADNGTTNGELIMANGSETRNAVLDGRTLWCDGDWNTLCLPFDVDLTDVDCPLAKATARTLESASLSDDGIHLVLNFGEPVEKLEAGVPYIIKWEASANNIVNPVFMGVTIDFDHYNFNSDDGRVQFCGNWDKLTFDEERQDILLLGAENQLFWPDGKASSTLGACRAYFFIGETEYCAAQIRSFELNFEGESETAIVNLKPEQDDDSCYTLDGRKVNQPGKGGITILRGKKVLNK
ncbi:MAG: hypothetical protein K6E73_11380 [Bacteroidales bacterium]|nr:hypothetical protein [Bacteroidales bacterium]